MSLFHDARKSLVVAARCLAAYRRGEESPEAEAGALIEAENYHLDRVRPRL